MHIQILGINHKTAPVDIREKISFTAQNISRALIDLKQYETIQEHVILSTCNRVELYAVSQDLHKGRENLEKFLADFHDIDIKQLKPHFYYYYNAKAIEHLFRVVASLDSMIIGETQIFGQVKNAYRIAKELNATGKVFNNLFRKAITIGKRVRAETDIGKGAVSIGSTAVELSQKIFNDLTGKKILVIGTGKASRLTLKNLTSCGAAELVVLNRTYARAEAAAKEFSAEAAEFKELEKYLEKADIVISSSASPHIILNKRQVLKIMPERRQRPLFLIDLGVPRNIEAAVNNIDNVFLYNIDDLGKIRDKNLKIRLSAAKKAEEIITRILERYLSSRGVFLYANCSS